MLIAKNENCQILEQYLAYLTVIKGRSENTVVEYRNDLIMFFRFVKDYRQHNNPSLNLMDCSDIDIEFIKLISIHEMYSYIAYCQKQGKLSASTRARRIVSIRQFWKYL